MGILPEKLKRHSTLLVALSSLVAPVWAAEVALAGLLPNRAIVVVDGGNPRTLAVGASIGDGVKLLAVEDGAAVFLIAGKRQRLVLGDHAVASGGSGGGAAAVALTADGRGQFFTQGAINGIGMRFMVDTGATFVSLSAGDAARANIDFRGKGRPGLMATANGTVKAWTVPGNTVRLGDIVLHEVDISVHEADMPIVLLGMSFLNRMEMKRDGDTMTLKKRF